MKVNKESEELVSQSYLKSLISYNPDTGVFTWIKSGIGISKDLISGYIENNGYRRIKINGKKYLGNRLAWLYMTGEWPSRFIDHINGEKDDDRFCNLREATQSQNCMNRKTTSKNTSGTTGVSWSKNDKKWVSYINVNRKRKTLGLFKDKERAIQVRKFAEFIYHREFSYNQKG